MFKRSFVVLMCAISLSFSCNAMNSVFPKIVNLFSSTASTHSCGYLQIGEKTNFINFINDHQNATRLLEAFNLQIEDFDDSGCDMLFDWCENDKSRFDCFVSFIKETKTLNYGCHNKISRNIALFIDYILLRKRLKKIIRESDLSAEELEEALMNDYESNSLLSEIAQVEDLKDVFAEVKQEKKDEEGCVFLDPYEDVFDSLKGGLSGSTSVAGYDIGEDTGDEDDGIDEDLMYAFKKLVF